MNVGHRLPRGAPSFQPVVVVGAGAAVPGPGATRTPVSIAGTIDGATGSDGNAVFTLGAAVLDVDLFKNGVLQYPGVAYNLVGTTITFLAPHIPIVGDELYAKGMT